MTRIDCLEIEQLLSDFLEKTVPSLPNLQPETLLPHYAEAGCGASQRFPQEGVYGEVRYSNLASIDLFIDHDWQNALSVPFLLCVYLRKSAASYFYSSLSPPISFDTRAACVGR